MIFLKNPTPVNFTFVTSHMFNGIYRKHLQASVVFSCQLNTQIAAQVSFLLLDFLM